LNTCNPFLRSIHLVKRRLVKTEIFVQVSPSPSKERGNKGLRSIIHKGGGNRERVIRHNMTE
jgi:hypothetical protein